MMPVAVVVIGRNEGERLVRALRSVGGCERVVYVDSGSRDGSVAAAGREGAEVVELDTTLPFTAARGRNAGLSRLRGTDGASRYVQFLDGDCEMAAGWLERAASFLDAHPRTAAVFGRLRERFPERSFYNRLCDLEWDQAPVGEARACGGIVLMREDALTEVGGFREDVIAGEEPELCARLRARGWSIHRIDAEMALHDAAMTRFGQWWKRAVRAGHAWAQGAWLHAGGTDCYGVRPVLSALLWSVAIPLLTLTLAMLLSPWWLLLLLFYPAQWARMTVREARRGRPLELAWRHAALLLIAKFAHAAGIARFGAGLLARRPARIIEYKAPGLPELVGAPEAAPAAGGRL
jgi:GT2 family glycosyltransferase